MSCRQNYMCRTKYCTLTYMYMSTQRHMYMCQHNDTGMSVNTTHVYMSTHVSVSTQLHTWLWTKLHTRMCQHNDTCICTCVNYTTYVCKQVHVNTVWCTLTSGMFICKRTQQSLHKSKHSHMYINTQDVERPVPLGLSLSRTTTFLPLPPSSSPGAWECQSFPASLHCSPWRELWQKGQVWPHTPKRSSTEYTPQKGQVWSHTPKRRSTHTLNRSCMDHTHWIGQVWITHTE